MSQPKDKTQFAESSSPVLCAHLPPCPYRGTRVKYQNSSDLHQAMYAYKTKTNMAGRLYNLYDDMHSLTDDFLVQSTKSDAEWDKKIGRLAEHPTDIEFRDEEEYKLFALAYQQLSLEGNHHYPVVNATAPAYLLTKMLKEHPWWKAKCVVVSDSDSDSDSDSSDFICSDGGYVSSDSEEEFDDPLAVDDEGDGPQIAYMDDQGNHYEGAAAEQMLENIIEDGYEPSGPFSEEPFTPAPIPVPAPAVAVVVPQVVAVAVAAPVEEEEEEQAPIEPRRSGRKRKATT